MKKFSIDVFIGDKYAHTMTVEANSYHVFEDGRIVERVDMKQVWDQVDRRLPVTAKRKDIKIYFNS